MNANKASAIVCARDFDAYDKDNWPEMASWLVDHVKKFEQTFAPEVKNLQALLR